MASHYDSFDYSSYWKGRDYEDISEKIALKKLFNIIPEDKKEEIVDIGGGFGRLSEIYCGLFKKCVVIEPSVGLIKTGNKKNIYKNLKFIKGSLPHLKMFKDQSVQNIILIRVIHHLGDLSSSISEIYRILKKDGYFILEIANKIHFLARLRALFSGKWQQINNPNSIDLRSIKSVNEQKIVFFNHNPKKILKDLVSLGFTVEKILSVSNLRSPFTKKVVPLKILIAFEKLFQGVLSKIYFGPSIFVLVKKTK